MTEDPGINRNLESEIIGIYKKINVINEIQKQIINLISVMERRQKSLNMLLLSRYKKSNGFEILEEAIEALSKQIDNLIISVRNMSDGKE